ncbi:unnamed protein product [Miscanthus lutarioriparius]|uniref:Uncharacterized protein n=1 Tax=Miscanthus lutarioriparius TaxID=422564 RepID=A0A811NAH9_9POAL|nr:unnamed protein product [Miscanthus lutarioriparius]
MAAAPPQKNNLLRTTQELKTTIMYERNIMREIRVLDAKIGKLELQLNSLLEEIISKPQGSLCSSVWAERDRARAKRDRAYQKLQCQQLEMEIQDHNDQGGAPNHPASAVGADASNYRICKELSVAS